MCGRFTLTADADTLHAEFGIEVAAEYAPRYNIAPTQPVMGVASDGMSWRAGLLNWGLVPSWAADRSGAARLINARAETLLEKRSFRDAFANRRCLVLADGFYEWQGEGKHRRPLYIRRRDGRPFAFAGLWERWYAAKDAPPWFSCTIVTTTPNVLLRPVHDRMPVILSPRAQTAWLDPVSDSATLFSLLQPYDATELELRPVSTLVNSAQNDVPECIAAL